MKTFKQIKVAIKIEYCWRKIKRLKKREAFLKKLLSRVISEKYLYSRRAEELSIYYENISGYRDATGDESLNMPNAA